MFSKGFDGHHFIAGLASHFRDLLVAKNPATLSLLEMGEAAQKLYGQQSQKVSQEFLLKGIDIANDCDLKYKVSQNQRLLVELSLMQLSSIGFDGEKKKSDFIIPPTYYRRNDYSIAEVNSKSQIPNSNTAEEVVNPKAKEEIQIAEGSEQKAEVVVEKVQESKTENRKPITDNGQPKVSAMSLSSIRAKKEMAETLKSTVKEVVHLVSESFTETEMLEQWVKYAQKLNDKGQHIMASLITINDPILEGSKIIHELPNESSKLDFEKDKEFLGYLRGKLHNHDITIEVRVNETLVLRKSTRTIDKYNRLVELNPNLELMREMFGLEINE